MRLREPQGKFHGRRSLCQFNGEAFFLVSDYALNFLGMIILCINERAEEEKQNSNFAFFLMKANGRKWTTPKRLFQNDCLQNIVPVSGILFKTSTSSRL